VPGKNQDIAARVASQFPNKSRVERRILPGQIHFANHGAARGGIVVFLSGDSGKNGDNGEKQGDRKGKAHVWQL
jgi:hypothetical protein